MKVAVVGLGAVGGLIAARLAAAGHAVSALARGETLARVRERGLRGRFRRQADGGADRRRRARRGALGPQELVVDRPEGAGAGGAGAADRAAARPATVVLPAMNGVPWWFMPRRRAFRAAAAKASIPAAGSLAALPIARVLGCVVHLAASCPEPGLVRHGFGERLIVGEPAGGDSARVGAVCAALAGAGFEAEASADVRREVWYKLWGNMTMNPVSALTGAESDAILDDPLVHAFMMRTMAEAAAIGERIGCPIAAVRRGAHGPGAQARQLQDLDAPGRPRRPADRARRPGHARCTRSAARVGVATPNIGALLGLTRLMAQQRGLYPARSA